MKTYTVLFLTLALLLSGCSLLNKPPEEPAVVVGETGELTLLPDGSAGIVTCSETCEKKSQCGIADGNAVVMGKSNDQAVDPMIMDMMLADKTAVSIITSRQRTVQKTGGDLSQQNIFFYNVTANDGKSGWIAGWCVAATTQPQPPTE